MPPTSKHSRWLMGLTFASLMLIGAVFAEEELLPFERPEFLEHESCKPANKWFTELEELSMAMGSRITNSTEVMRVWNTLVGGMRMATNANGEVEGCVKRAHVVKAIEQYSDALPKISKAEMRHIMARFAEYAAAQKTGADIELETSSRAVKGYDFLDSKECKIRVYCESCCLWYDYPKENMFPPKEFYYCCCYNAHKEVLFFIRDVYDYTYTQAARAICFLFPPNEHKAHDLNGVYMAPPKKK